MGKSLTRQPQKPLISSALRTAAANAMRSTPLRQCLLVCKLRCSDWLDLGSFVHWRTTDFKQLKAFLTVAETGSVTHASPLLNIVQPAFSRQLRMLEEDVGAVLSDRSRHGIERRDDGKKLIEYARRVLNEIERARAELMPSKGSIGGIATIGLLPSTCDLLSSA